MTARPSWQHSLFASVALPLMRVRRNNTVSRLPKTLAAEAKKPEPAPRGAAARNMTVEQVEHRDWTVWKLTPEGVQPDRRVILAIHGGAYVHSLSPMHYAFYAQLARDVPATAVVPLYPLAPKGTAAVVVPAMADLLSDLIGRVGADYVSVTGDSAGGGLALAAVREIGRRGVPAPRSLVLVSPWLDVTLPDPRSATIADPMLDAEGLKLCGQMWAGELDPRDPTVSPLNGPFAGLPPIAVYAGTKDLLFPDSVKFAEDAANAGVPVDLDLRPGLIHGWAMLPFTPEGKQAIAKIARQLGADAAASR